MNDDRVIHSGQTSACPNCGFKPAKDGKLHQVAASVTDEGGNVPKSGNELTCQKCGHTWIYLPR